MVHGMRNLVSRLMAVVRAGIEGPSKHTYKIVDLERKNDFIFKIRSQLNGKNIVIEESLEELISRDEKLSGYSPGDVNIIMRALYDYKYKSRYKLQSVNYESDKDASVVLEDLFENKVINCKVSGLFDEVDVLARLGEVDKRLLFYHMMQMALAQEKKKLAKLKRKDAVLSFKKNI